MNDREKRKVTPEEIKKITEFIEAVEYGSVTIVVQNGAIVQIEKNEKLRLK